MHKIIKFTFLLCAIADVALSNGLDIYWNIPTFMCQQYGLHFTDAVTSFNIVQNKGDQFIGDKIGIIYEPGLLPSLSQLANGSFDSRNGGVPQKSDLSKHIDAFKKDVDALFPDVNTDGIIIIAFKMCRPILRQNFGTLVPCKTVSYEIEQSLNPPLNQSQVELEAAMRFEKAARNFMETTLKVAKELRPKAKWGAYAYPICLNDVQSEDCSSATRAENDQLHWLFEATDVVLPALFLNEHYQDANDRPKVIRGRVREAVRVAQQQNHKPPVIAYIQYSYRDSGKPLSRDDLEAVLETSKQTEASGIIVWGSSVGLNTEQKCIDFSDYLETTLGPTLAQYAKRLPQPLPPMA